MADNSSEQVPGQQTGESSAKDRTDDRGEDDTRGDDVGLGSDASAG